MEQLIEKLKTSDVLSFREYKTLLEDVYNTLSSKNMSEEDYSLCLRAICWVAESNIDDKPLIKALLKECIYKSRVFLYEDTLYKKYGADYFSKVREQSIRIFGKILLYTKK